MTGIRFEAYVYMFFQGDIGNMFSYCSELEDESRESTHYVFGALGRITARCITVRSWTLKQQLVKYAAKSLLGTDWKIGVFASSFCALPFWLQGWGCR